MGRSYRVPKPKMNNRSTVSFLAFSLPACQIPRPDPVASPASDSECRRLAGRFPWGMSVGKSKAFSNTSGSPARSASPISPLHLWLSSWGGDRGDATYAGPVGKPTAARRVRMVISLLTKAICLGLPRQSGQTISLPKVRRSSCLFLLPAPIRLSPKPDWEQPPRARLPAQVPPPKDRGYFD